MAKKKYTFATKFDDGENAYNEGDEIEMEPKDAEQWLEDGIIKEAGADTGADDKKPAAKADPGKADSKS